MSDQCVVDTNVLSLILKGYTRAPAYAPHLAGRQGIISFITLAELRRWPAERDWGERRRAALDALLSRFHVQYADEAMCNQWADLAAAARNGGWTLPFADSWIAATALRLELPLVTHNPRDFARVPNLTVISEAELPLSPNPPATRQTAADSAESMRELTSHVRRLVDVSRPLVRNVTAVFQNLSDAGRALDEFGDRNMRLTAYLLSLARIPNLDPGEQEVLVRYLEEMPINEIVAEVGDGQSGFVRQFVSAKMGFQQNSELIEELLVQDAALHRNLEQFEAVLEHIEQTLEARES